MNQISAMTPPQAVGPTVHYRLPWPDPAYRFFPAEVFCSRTLLIGILADLNQCRRAFVVRPDLPDQRLDPLSERLAATTHAFTSLFGWPRGSREKTSLSLDILDLEREIDFRGERQLLASPCLPGTSPNGGQAMVIAVAPAGINACDLTFIA